MIRKCKFCKQDYTIPKLWSKLAQRGFIPFNEICPKCMIQRYDWERAIALSDVLNDNNPLMHFTCGDDDHKHEAKRVLGFMSEHPDQDPRCILFKKEYEYTEENYSLIV